MLAITALTVAAIPSAAIAKKRKPPQPKLTSMTISPDAIPSAGGQVNVELVAKNTSRRLTPPRKVTFRAGVNFDTIGTAKTPRLRPKVRQRAFTVSVAIPASNGALGVTPTLEACLDPQRKRCVSATFTYLRSQLTVSPAALNFGNVPLGTSSPPQTLTATNVGGAAAGSLQVIIRGPESSRFPQMTNCPGTLPAGASCSISASFSPGAGPPGAHTATMEVRAASQTILVPLTGNAV